MVHDLIKVIFFRTKYTAFSQVIIVDPGRSDFPDLIMQSLNSPIILQRPAPAGGGGDITMHVTEPGGEG